MNVAIGHASGLGSNHRLLRLRISRRMLFEASIGMVVVMAVALCPFKVGMVRGSSMTPSMSPNQFFVLDRGYYRSHKPVQGEVIVFRHGGTTMIKRIIGLPGNTVWLFDFKGDEPYSDILTLPELPAMRLLAERKPQLGHLRFFVVPDGKLFVAGDFRSGSVDSRTFGPIPMDEVYGRVVSAPPPLPNRKFGRGRDLVSRL